MIKKQYVRTKHGSKCRLTFVLPELIWADSVFVVGSFNAWDKTASPMHQDGNGQWKAVVEVDPGAVVQFRYLCDGDWINDNQADAYWLNDYGGHNSVVFTEAEPET
ncbi:MAG: isoamylase early set domain-containing protein [Caldilineales bacterium]